MLPSLVILLPTGSAAQSEAPGVGVYVAPEPAAREAPPELATRAARTILTLERLPAAAEGARESLEELREWNRLGNVPLRNGFARPLARPRAVRIASQELPVRGERPFGGGVLAVEDGWVSWLAVVEVEAAYALRARIRIDSLPESAEIWTLAPGGEVLGPFGAGMVGPEGDLWLPPVEGPRVAVEVRAPVEAVEAGGVLALRIEEVVERPTP